MKRLFTLAMLSAALLAGCSQTRVQPVANQALLGKLEVNFDSQAQAARATFTPATTTNGVQSRAVLLDENQLNFNVGSRIAQTITAASSNERFLTAQFPISNGTGAIINRLTLVAYVKSGNIGETAVKNITNFGGATLTDISKARAVKPSHAMKATGCAVAPCVDAINAGLQVFSQAEVTNLTSLAGAALANNENLLAYGFVARNANTRNIQANNNSSDGLVTIAVRVPSSGAGATGDAYSFTMTFLVFKQPTSDNAFVQSLEEQTENTVAGQSPASLPTGAQIRILPGGTQNFASVRGMTNVRTAGSSNVVAVLGTWLQTSPNGIFTRTNPLELIFPQVMNVPSSTTAKLWRLMGVGSTLNSAASKTLSFGAPTMPARPFFPNELLIYRFKNLTTLDSNLESFPSLGSRSYIGAARASAGGTGTGNFVAGSTFAVSATAEDVEVFDKSNAGALNTDVGGYHSVADMDNDGDLDTVTHNLNQIFISANDGTGATTLSRTLATPAGESVWTTCLTDLDADGTLDVVASTSSSNLASVVVFNSSNNYAATNYDGLNYPAITCGDADNDGDMDVIAVDFSDPPRIYTFRNDGAGALTISAPMVSTALSNNRVISADLNGDGALDLMLLHNRNVARSVDIYLNDGTGIFTADSIINPVAFGADYAAVGDIDADGDLDFVFTVDSNINTEDGLYIYKNNGSGGFSSAAVIAIPNPHGVRLADTDGDNDLDAYVISNLDTSTANLQLVINNP